MRPDSNQRGRGLGPFCLLGSEKGRDLTQSYDKAPTPIALSKNKRDNTSQFVSLLFYACF